MRSNKKLLLLMLTLPLAWCARASGGKTDGVLHGYVTDALTKKPLPGVTVSATFPGTNNYKEVMTDADGYFRFLELPAAQVTVQFEKKGYQPCKRPGVTIKEKISVTLNMECSPEDMEMDANSEYPLLRLMQAS
jgi:hypothetical protein